jgi:hypothetical protein
VNARLIAFPIPRAPFDRSDAKGHPELLVLRGGLSHFAVLGFVSGLLLRVLLDPPLVTQSNPQGEDKDYSLLLVIMQSWRFGIMEHLQ